MMHNSQIGRLVAVGFVVMIAVLSFFVITPKRSESLAPPRKEPDRTIETLPSPVTVRQPVGADSISAILGDETLTAAEAVRRLLDLLPELGAADRKAAARHIVNLSGDHDVGLWASPLVANEIPPPADQVLFDSLANRPDVEFYPNVAAIADLSSHPLQKESQEILEVLFGPPQSELTWRAWVEARVSKSDNQH